MSTFLNQFGVTQVPITVESDIRLNIIKRREAVLYHSTTSIDDINLLYIISKELNSQKNLFISDRSTELAANRIPENIQPIVFHGKTFSLIVDKFIATDIFIQSISQSNVPLFFKHILKNFTTGTIHDFSIKDNSMKSVTPENVLFDKDNGIFYNNLVNDSDLFYYITYSINVSGTINSYIEILDNELIYLQATIDDIDATGALIDGRKIYTIEQFSSNLFEVRFPNSKLYAIQEQPNSRLRLIQPPSTGNQNGWFISVTNGTFFATLFNSPTSYGIFKYNIPEFTTQLFNPEFPFKFRSNEICTQIDNKVIKVLKSNLDSNKFIDVIIRNPDRTPRFALTTNPSKSNTLFEDTILFQNGIRSIDRLNGIIDLLININDTDIIEASYYFSETEYEIIDIDFNPINNISILEKRIVFYIVPNTNDSRNKTLYYLIVNKQGFIEITNQTDNTSLLTDIATGTFLYDKVSVSLNFINKYTVQATNQFANPTNPQYLVLGDVFVSSNTHPDSSVLFDIRKQGGGIKKTPGLIKQLAVIDPEITWTTEIGGWDGIPYPANGSMLIELPVTLKAENGGRFNDVELREIAERHMALGMYAILRGYGTNIHPIVESL